MDTVPTAAERAAVTMRSQAALVLKKELGVLRGRQAKEFIGERQRTMRLLQRLIKKIEVLR